MKTIITGSRYSGFTLNGEFPFVPQSLTCLEHRLYSRTWRNITEHGAKYQYSVCPRYSVCPSPTSTVIKFVYILSQCISVVINSNYYLHEVMYARLDTTDNSD
jgi:hypothetical protein